MIYIVLGMHKSGTTLVSQMLHRSGGHFGLERTGTINEWFQTPRPQPHLAIDDEQHIRQPGRDRKHRSIQKPDGVSEVVHG